MSTIKVDTITTRSGSGEISLGTTGSQTINRTGDGDLIAFQKGGADSGSISIETSGTAFDGEASHAGLKMFLGSVAPRQNGSDVDNLIDLGWTGGRFKDIYLGGGLYVGGTGAANKLDDYEEGTFTPIWRVTGGANSFNYTNQTGRYTKIGNRVFGLGRVTSNSHSGSGGAVSVQGFPFTSTNVTTVYHHFTFGHFTGFSYTGTAYGYVNSNTIYAEIQSNNNGSIATPSYPSSGALDIIFSFVYETDA